MTDARFPKMYESLYGKHPDPVIVTDFDGRIAYANAAACATFGLEEGEPSRLRIHDRVSPNDVGALDAFLEQAAGGESQSFRVAAGQGDGTFPKETRVVAVPIGCGANPEALVLYIADATEPKREEALLRDATRELAASFIEHCRDPILLLDTDATIVLANPAFSRLLGWRKEKLEGFHILQCPSIPPRLVVQMRDYFRRAIAAYGAGSPHAGELEFLETMRMTDEGVEYPMTLTIAPMYRSGEICNWAVHLRNVSDRKQLEAQVKELERKQAIADELHRLEHLNTVTRLAASISHEVRNPLTVTRGFIQLLNHPALPPEKRAEYIELGLRELDRAERIMNDYLTFAKPAPDEAERLEVNGEVAYVAKAMTPFAKMKGVRYTSRTVAEPMYVYGNAKKFQQALMNLVKNGIESMYRGGELLVETSKAADDIALIRISDDGAGMDADALKRLGRPFYTTKDKGTGLGTMVAFSILQSMHGEIEVDSKVGEGTRIWIYLPVTSAAGDETGPMGGA